MLPALTLEGWDQAKSALLSSRRPKHTKEVSVLYQRLFHRKT